MPNPFKAIIFDMDGTLLDSEGVWHVVEDDMFTARNIEYTDDARQQVIGLRIDEFWQKLIDIYQLDDTVDALTEELIQRMTERIPTEVKPKPGAPEIVQYAVESGLPYCIASSSPKPIIEAMVKAQNWQDLIPQRYSADAVTNGKPAPDVYLYAAEKLGVAPGDCLALEDSPAGAKSAVAAGMTTYVIPDYHTSAAAFDAITPHVFKSLHDVLAQLKA